MRVVDARPWLFGGVLAWAGCLDSPGDGNPGGPPDAATMIHLTRAPDVAIEDPGVTSDSLAVVPECSIATVSVEITIYHDDRGDLEIVLESPAPRALRLKDASASEVGGDVIGTYPLTLVPVESLDLLADTNATGQWTLSVRDTSAGTSGTLDSWGLTIDCR
jgi:subtilisin-like proprotein convertase family protein